MASLYSTVGRTTTAYQYRAPIETINRLPSDEQAQIVGQSYNPKLYKYTTRTTAPNMTMVYDYNQPQIKIESNLEPYMTSDFEPKPKSKYNYPKDIDTDVPKIEMYEEVKISGKPFKKILNFDSIYLQQEVLGHGTFGVVSKYLDIRNNKMYAIKFVFIKDNAQLNDIHNEIMIMRYISDSSIDIVNYYGSFLIERDGKLYYAIVMDYIQGISLDTYIKYLIDNRQSMEYDKLYQFAIWLFTTISKLHSYDIVHRDIKPDNIMVNLKTGRFILIDFGIACSIHDGYEYACDINSFISPLLYTAPEIYKYTGQNRTTIPNAIDIYKKADIWQCGITLYVLINHKLPWENESDRELVNEIKGFRGFDQLFFPKDVPILNDLITACTRPDYTTRPTAMESLHFLNIKKDKFLAMVRH